MLTYWTTDDYPQSNKERVQMFRRLASNYCEPVKYLSEWVGDDTHMFPDRFRYWSNPSPWDNHAGRLTLAGDAAHPMTPCEP